MTSMSKISLHVQIRRRDTLVAGILAWDMKTFDQTIIACRTDLWFSRATSSGENNISHGIKMATEAIAQLEVSTFSLLGCGIQREFMFRTPSA
jgi:hypothetical protein